MKAAKAAAKDIGQYRIALEKKRKELKADVLVRGRLIDGEAKRIADAARGARGPDRRPDQGRGAAHRSGAPGGDRGRAGAPRRGRAAAQGSRGAPHRRGARQARRRALSGIRAKQRAIAKAVKARAGAKCQPKITVAKGGARSCSTCSAKAATGKTIMLCARTGRLPK
jgi:hypothetical protein